ncbi:MAG: HAMP domain-containing histidine kinase [Patescibacteria group bacterium]|nr:HAMP domain-containing histidine kinase [Patescibacteria group bacterium]
MTYRSDASEVIPSRVERGPHTVVQSMAASAHELKSLLTGILLLAEQITLESPCPEGGNGHLVHQILEGGQQMKKCINGLLQAAASDFRNVPVLRTRCNLSTILRQVVKSNWEYAMSKGIRLRCPNLELRECWGQINEECIRIAVDNLVNNAIKYSSSETEIQVRLVPHQRNGISHALIQVKDQGPGLTADDMAKAFSPFQTLSARPTGNESSTGLGLSIVREAVEQLGGRTWIESRHGQGTTVCIDLPLEIPIP